MSDLIVPKFEVAQRRVAYYGLHLGWPSNEPTANVGGINIATEVDPRKILAAFIWNQWAMGSCTANCTTNHFRYDATIDGHDPGPLCRLGVYWGERKIEGMIGQGDTGAYGHDAFTVAKAGIPLETAWKYDWSGMTSDSPPPEKYFDPKTEPKSYTSAEIAYKLTKQVAAVPQNEAAIKAVLSNKQLVSLGFVVYESFEQDWSTPGEMPMPQQGEQQIGGHEVLLCGYLRKYPNYALVANSWGTDWGLEGFFLMPWRYILNRQLVSDLRTIVRPIAA
jgi:hypothetical protein